MRVFPLIAATIAGAVLSLTLTVTAALATHTTEDVTIPIVSAWGGTAPDVDITYQIKAGGGVPSSVVAVVQDAIDNWNTAISERESGWTFDFVSFAGSPPTKPDITIHIKKGGGAVVGTGVPRINPLTGLVRGCTVTISGQFATLPPDPDQILITAWQELGHCFGLGHADQPEDPMCSGFGCANLVPTDNSVWHCDADAFVLAHHWLTTDGSAPHAPHNSSLTCSGS